MIFEFQCKHCGCLARKARGRDRPPVFCSMQCRKDWHAANPKSPATKEWFYEKYINEGLDCVQIGKLLNKDTKTVWYWLKKYDIPTRGRGTTGNWKHVKQHGMLGKTHTDEVREKLRKARLKDGHVPYLKNGKHHLKGKRGDQTPNWRGGVTPQRQSFYSSPEWKIAVKVVWKRDNATCQRCGLHHTTARKQGIAFHIHHIVSFQVKRLRAEPSNLILLCRPCHLWVHSSENAEKHFIKHITDERN